jgi:hypothetical protein
MAFEADCGFSMVLEALRVASAAWHLVPGDSWVFGIVVAGPKGPAYRILRALCRRVL